MKKIKSLLILALFGLSFMANGQNDRFVIHGKVGWYSSPAKAYLLYQLALGEMPKTDSALIENGVFTFKGTVPYPVETFLVINPRGAGFINVSNTESIKLYLEPGTISVTSPDSLGKAKIVGGQVNADNEKLKLLLKPIDKKYLLLRNEFDLASKEGKKEIERQMDSMEEPKRAIHLNFMKANPDHLMSLVSLKKYAGYVPKVNEVEPLFYTLSPDVRASNLGIAYAGEIKRLKTTAVGAIAPDFSQNDTSGRAVSLHDYKGKYVMVDFWASGCGACREENPDVVKAYEKYKDKGFNILGVSLDMRKTSWLKAIHDDQLPWTQVSDLKSWDNEVAKLYFVMAIPQNFLVNPDGKIVAKDLHGAELDRTLAGIFQ